MMIKLENQTLKNLEQSLKNKKEIRIQLGGTCCSGVSFDLGVGSPLEGHKAEHHGSLTISYDPAYDDVIKYYEITETSQGRFKVNFVGKNKE